MLDYDGSRNYLLFPNFKDKAFVAYFENSPLLLSKLEVFFSKIDNYATCSLNVVTADKVQFYEKYANFDYLVGCFNNVLDTINSRNQLENTFCRIVKGATVGGMEGDVTHNILKSCGIKFSLNSKIFADKFSIPRDGKTFFLTANSTDKDLSKKVNSYLYENYNNYYWFNDVRLFILKVDDGILDNTSINDLIYNDGVWVANLTKVYEYVNAYDRLEFSMDGNRVYNPSFIDVYIKYNNKKYVIYSGQTIDLI